MIGFTTESGAVYLYDKENARLLRSGPHSEGIDYLKVPDDEWHEVLHADPIEVGVSAGFALGVGKYRITTPVASIREVEV